MHRQERLFGSVGCVALPARGWFARRSCPIPWLRHVGPVPFLEAEGRLRGPASDRGCSLVTRLTQEPGKSPRQNRAPTARALGFRELWRREQCTP